MKSKHKLIRYAITSILALTTSHFALAATATDQKMEKCYGIVKAGKNDCQTSTESCAGSAKKDKQRDAFIFLPKGTCEKIVDASLESKK